MEASKGLKAELEREIGKWTSHEGLSKLRGCRGARASKGVGTGDQDG